jgi:hypothetical protein
MEMQTFFFDTKDGVPMCDRIGVEFDTSLEAIAQCGVLAHAATKAFATTRTSR